MQDDLEVLDQKKAAAARAEKTAGQLKKEVRLLQEALADNNIIIDKVWQVLARTAADDQHDYASTATGSAHSSKWSHVGVSFSLADTI